MNYKCALCQSDLEEEYFPNYTHNISKWYCFKHEEDVWFGITVEDDLISRTILQFPDCHFGDVIRVIHWEKSEHTWITDRFERELIPPIKFKPDFSNLEDLKKKVKTCFVFS